MGTREDYCSGYFCPTMCKSTYFRSYVYKDRVHGETEELNLDYYTKQQIFILFLLYDLTSKT